MTTAIGRITGLSQARPPPSCAAYASVLVGQPDAVAVGGHRGVHQFRLQDVERAGVDLLRLSRWQRDRVARLLLVVPEQLLHIVLAAELPEGLHEVGLAAHEMSRGDLGAAPEC